MRKCFRKVVHWAKMIQTDLLNEPNRRVVKRWFTCYPVSISFYPRWMSADSFAEENKLTLMTDVGGPVDKSQSRDAGLVLKSCGEPIGQKSIEWCRDTVSSFPIGQRELGLLADRVQREACRLWTSRRRRCQQDCPRCLVSCSKQTCLFVYEYLRTLFCQFDTKSQHVWCWRKIIQLCDMKFFSVSHTPDVSVQLIMKHSTHRICCRLSLAPNQGGVCKTDHSARPSAHPTQHTTS